MAADHDIDRFVELPDDIEDRAGEAWTLVVIAGRKTAFVDQDHDGLDAVRLQFRHERVHRVGLVAEFEAGDALRGDDAGRALQGQADEGNGNTVELSDLVGREDGLAVSGVEGGGGQIMKFGAGKRMRPLAFVDGMTAAVLHPQQFVLALVELVIADR